MTYGQAKRLIESTNHACRGAKSAEITRDLSSLMKFSDCIDASILDEQMPDPTPVVMGVIIILKQLVVGSMPPVQPVPEEEVEDKHNDYSRPEIIDMY